MKVGQVKASEGSLVLRQLGHNLCGDSRYCQVAIYSIAPIVWP